MSKRLEQVVKKSDDLKKIMRAIGGAIDPRDVEEGLQALGFDVEVDTIDYGNEFGTITIEGGENETGVILTLNLVKIEIGYDTLTVSHDRSPEDAS